MVLNYILIGCPWLCSAAPTVWYYQKSFSLVLYGFNWFNVISFHEVNFFHRSISRCQAPPKSLADPSEVEKAVKILTEAKRPLVIIGKGNETLQTKCNLFLTSWLLYWYSNLTMKDTQKWPRNWFERLCGNFNFEWNVKVQSLSSR